MYTERLSREAEVEQLQHKTTHFSMHAGWQVALTATGRGSLPVTSSHGCCMLALRNTVGTLGPGYIWQTSFIIALLLSV